MLKLTNAIFLLEFLRLCLSFNVNLNLQASLMLGSLVSLVLQWCIQAVWETSLPGYAPKLWHPENTSQVFLYFKKKFVAVVINDFPMHLIISKWQTDKNVEKNADRRQKQWDNKK